MSGFREWANYSRYYSPKEEVKINQHTLFILNSSLHYCANDGAEYKVPTKTISDLGSIPKLLWPILPRDEFPSSYFLHDYLCEQNWISRIDTDKLLHEALIHSRASKWKVRIIYIGVRIGAWVAKVKNWYLK